MTIGEEMIHILEPENFAFIRVAGVEIAIRDSVISMWILMIVLIVVVKIMVKDLRILPGRKQSIVEAFIEMINNLVKNNASEKNFLEIAPFIGTMILFISFLNIAAILNVIPDSNEMYSLTGWNFFARMPVVRIFPPTKDINITMGLAVASIGMVLYKTLKVKKLKGGLHTFIEPVPLMLPFKMLHYIVRPLSLTLRMFGNVMAAYIMMELIYLAFPLIVPGVLSLYFDLFEGILQAFIFTFLTTLYMAEALE